jgi:hypothetical protein
MSRAIPMCEISWPTASVKGNYNRKGLSQRSGDGLATAVSKPTVCPCRCHTSTSSPAGSPAKTSASPAKAPGLTGRARVFGQSTPASFASYDPATSSWRTSQLSLLEEWGEFSETWPRAGMTRSGTAYRLAPLAPLTRGIASGLLPTPAATEYGTNQGGGMGRTGPVRPSLGTMARKDLWPTPTAVTDTGGAALCKWGGAGSRAKLRTLVSPQELNGALNPTWVEWLMGFPLGWTGLEVSETRSSRRSPNGSGGGS